MSQNPSRPAAFDVRPVQDADRPWVVHIVHGWGADFVVARGRRIHPQDLPGFCAVAADGEYLGLVTFEIVDDACQVVAVHRDLREVARRLKPQIPLVGNFGIPIRDEIELEMLLAPEEHLHLDGSPEQAAQR